MRWFIALKEMTARRAMNVYCVTSLLAFIQNAIAYVDIKGELTFDLYTPNVEVNRNVEDGVALVNNGPSEKARAKELKNDVKMKGDKRTANATKDDCVYQFPNKKQVEVLLSDMMNQLTKIFVRTYDFMSQRDSRRNAKRFKIVGQKFNSSFFEEAYNLMTEEYRKSVNESTAESRLSIHDPCHHQPELKEIWRKLLANSKATLRKAAVRCVSDFLRVRNRADDTRTKERLAQLLLREIKEVRSNQIKVLCDTFNLCYKELL